MRELVKDNERFYVLVEEDSGRLVLEVLCGGVAMYEKRLELSAEQVEDYRQGGKYFLDTLALKIARGLV